MNRKRINSMIGGKALRTVLTVAAVLLGVVTAKADGDTPATSTGPTIHGNVYGGGNLADVGGSVTVNMSTGEVRGDVYGGGALANTNINNATNYGTASETVSSTSVNTTSVYLTGGTINGDAYGGGLGRIGVEAKAAVEADPENGIEAQPAVAAVEEVKALVYGDVSVTLGNDTSATAFNISHYDGAHADVVKSGRVFGCNNLNGYPLGDVTVTVNKTVAGNLTRTTAEDLKDDAATHSYEVAAVYGGGNLADYQATGKKASVIIETCDVSIESVYGGGNAAAVPETDVLVAGAYEIGDVFGGGNGNDPYTLDGGTTWTDNAGANVNGNANTLLTGGYIHEAYGGSNRRGTITGVVSIDVGTGGACTLDVEKLVGAGKNADVDGDIIMVMGCKPSAKIPLLYAGADNANVNGNVELTITSGNFGRVFGGNNESGVIKGHIKVNIEETGECETPITIDELYLGGNLAAYSQYGYYLDTDGGTYLPRTAAMAALSEGDYGYEAPVAGRYTAPYDAPELNVVSCTSIGQVFGGGYGATAAMYGNPTVNINMIPGSHGDDLIRTGTAGHRLGDVGDVFGGGNAADVYGNTTVNIGTAETIAMNTEPTYLGSSGYTANATTGKYEVSAEGARITGNVYGGGNHADVKGNTFVNVCAVKTAVLDDNNEPTGEYTYNSVEISGESYEGVKILGSVYGGGNLGSVGTFSDSDFAAGGSTTCTANTGTATVTISGGTIGTNGQENGMVFGSSRGDVAAPDATGQDPNNKLAWVNETNVTIGISSASSNVTPAIKGSVYGGGENGHVLTDTHVAIHSGIIGIETGETIDGLSGADYPSRGNVYGGGSGTTTYDVTTGTGTEAVTKAYFNRSAGIVRGNATVTMDGGHVVRNIYGGGAMGSVGKYTRGPKDSSEPEDDNVPGPIASCATNTGLCTVTITGGEVGPANMQMPTNAGMVFGAGRGEVHDLADYPNLERVIYVNNTAVSIGGTAWVKGSVYGGSESGHVRHDTHVTVSGGQVGEGQGMGRVYTSEEWAYDGSETAKSLKECASWTFASPYAPYDPYANASGYYDDSNTQEAGGRSTGTDGHTFYGNVFGGGSGYYPYAAGQWLESAGLVEGNTRVDITGGHILTSVYGGNEMTNVGTGISGTGGKCVIRMTGGTVGVPRTAAQAQAHPVTCNLFGAGKGDQRVFFNKSTNVKEVDLQVTGGTVYGSVFGGGEDGHVLKDVSLTISGSAKVGTTGTSGFDGNVFGGGRGFGGVSLTSGNVGGSVELNIQENSVVLGSVYGGGRLASVGFGLFDTNETGYGVMQEDNKDDAGNTVANFPRGYVTINISGGTIGNDTESTLTHTKGGNVYGGSMGRVTQIDGTTTNSLWPRMAKVKEATVNISDGTIKANVYGGGELGTVTTNTKVEVNGGNLFRDLFGGGYGSNDYTTTTDGYTPMQLAGRVDGTTTVEVKGGWVKKNVYGGGEMASVGIMTLGTQHTDENSSFALSWPYASSYANNSNGNTNVTVTGGRIGITGKDKMGNKNDKGKEVKEDNGDVYGAGKGLVGDRYIYANCANVNNSTVLINYSSTPNPPVATAKNSSDACIAGSVYGGGENGHVIGNTQLTMQRGLVGHTLYGGGKGKDTYTTTLLVKDANGKKPGEDGYTETTGDVEIYSITAGKVYGNTNVTMSGGRVVRNIYGGGNMASVGKGNYSGGADDYTRAGYGETIVGNLWTNTDFMNTGKSTVTISDGIVGAVQTELEEGEDDMKDDLIFGNVFGGCRGEAAPNVSQTLSPRIHYYPEFYVGYVNETVVDIETGAKVLGSVYGGGEDGHVRRGTQVNINGGEIGLAYTEANQNYVGKNNKGNPYKISSDRWQQRGNVYGSGSGIGQYDTGEVEIVDEKEKAIMAYSYSAGSVTQSTEVNIKGGTVYKDVYGGGSLSTVGPPKIGQTAEPTKAQSLNKVTIDGGTVGEATGYAAGYGGNVYGASRGYSDFNLDQTVFTTTMFTEVNMKSGSVIGSLFGGGEVGIVKRGVEVNVTGGTVGHDVYGGGALANTNTSNWGTDTWATGMTSASNTTTVALKGGTVKGNAYGGGLGSADVAAKVYGDVRVNLNEPETTTMTTGEGEGATTTTTTTYGDCEVQGAIFGCNNLNGSPQGDVTVHIYKTVTKTDGTVNAKPTKDNTTYELSAVYGGGNLAAYYPDDVTTRAAATANVIIDGCDLTSIGTVYGGGNAASVPATEVVVNSTYEIGEVYGGGNGKDDVSYNGTTYVTNPGANVGYLAYTDDSEKASKAYGTGKAHATVYGGTVHALYGGSNTKGNIRVESRATLEDREDCPFNVGEAYGGGHNAPQDGDAVLEIGCISGLGKAYGGAANADVNGDVVLNITNGTYDQVFGGNDAGGAIRGSITVNIEETGCRPVIIGELYGGGCNAAYSIWGYDADGQPLKQGDTGANITPADNPTLNVKSFTSIGNIFGGGYGQPATMVADPRIYIDVVKGRWKDYVGESSRYAEEGYMYNANGYKGITKDIDGDIVTIPNHEAGKIGTINSVFGGGNQAKVVGTPHVMVGTQEYVEIATVTGDVTGYYTRTGEGTQADPYVYSEATGTAATNTKYYKKVEGVDIRGNVFGGGNNAEVDGDTDVVIGKRN